MKLTLSHAEAMFAKAKEIVAEQKIPPVSIVILDAGGHEVAFIRMDGTFIATIDIAHRKAKTAVYFRDSSANVGEVLHPNGVAYSLENSNGGLVGVGGGVPLFNTLQELVGAVGVSGASKEEDADIAEQLAQLFLQLS